MGWRTVIISNTSKLDYKMGYLVVRSNEEIKRIHLSEISAVIIETTAVSLTAYLLTELANEKITVVFCDQKRNPSGQYIPFYGNHNTSDKIRKQIHWEEKTKARIWQSVVEHKLLGQSYVLKNRGFQSESQKINNYILQIEPGDVTNREGHAAKVYFNRLFGNDFSRTDKDNITNAKLNYGYSVLLSLVNREVVANGYITQLGIHHDNMFNDFNLSCDLMEPFRPFVDLIVIDMIDVVFDKEAKHNLINIVNRKIYIDGKEQYFTNALTLYVKSILNSIENNDTTMIKYPNYELSIYESNRDV